MAKLFVIHDAPVRGITKDRCSFCLEKGESLKYLFIGNQNEKICDNCIDECNKIINVDVPSAA